MDSLKKFGIPVLLAAIGIAIAVVLYSVLTTPGGKSPEEIAATKPTETNPQNELLSTAQLQINRLETNLQKNEENVQRIFNNQKQLTDAIETLGAELEQSRKTAKDQRAYIAMLYQKVLDMELKTESLGGGLSGRRQNPAPAPNPLHGTDSLPAIPLTDPGVLPPLPE